MPRTLISITPPHRWIRYGLKGLLPGIPRNRLCRAAGIAPCKGVGEATRSARKPGGVSYCCPRQGLVVRAPVHALLLHVLEDALAAFLAAEAAVAPAAER